jgi:hypothetical protein
MDAHIVALDPSTAHVPSVVSYSIRIHSFCCVCYGRSVHIPFQNDLILVVTHRGWPTFADARWRIEDVGCKMAAVYFNLKKLF